ncbi:hypothetical protein EU527_08850 [Candidatus Thorarchaeota archaeon]|nr:MAG: hypothetical protein EU527_08850 [Candidatus Thorarchaeota archaeon]
MNKVFSLAKVIYRAHLRLFVDCLMLSAIGLSIYEYRKYLVLTLAISMIAIPIADILVIQRDRNRNEMYGEAFWIYGFGVYNMDDEELAEALEHMGFNDGTHTLPSYLGGVKYEYPVFGLIFFAIATWLFPGTGYLQPLWLNFLLVLVFNLNLALLGILLRDKLYKTYWARAFFGGYFIYGLAMSAGGGKLEPIVDCLLLMALVLWKENQRGKAMFTLGIAVQTKVYPVIAFPALFIQSPLSSIWFFASMFITVVPVFFGASFDSLISHLLNLSSYSPLIVNPMYPGLAFSTPDLMNPSTSYVWIPALLPLAIYAFFIMSTLRIFLPSKAEFTEKSIQKKLISLIPLYLYVSPIILFLFRWIMPWYLYWLAPIILLFKNDKHAMAYMRQIALIGLLYLYGLAVNWPYFILGPIPEFILHFPYNWGTIGGLVLLGALAAAAYGIWKIETDRRERKSILIKEAEARGELII